MLKLCHEDKFKTPDGKKQKKRVRLLQINYIDEKHQISETSATYSIGPYLYPSSRAQQQNKTKKPQYININTTSENLDTDGFSVTLIFKGRIM